MELPERIFKGRRHHWKATGWKATGQRRIARWLDSPWAGIKAEIDAPPWIAKAPWEALLVRHFPDMVSAFRIRRTCTHRMIPQPALSQDLGDPIRGPHLCQGAQRVAMLFRIRAAQPVHQPVDAPHADRTPRGVVFIRFVDPELRRVAAQVQRLGLSRLGFGLIGFLKKNE